LKSKYIDHFSGKILKPIHHLPLGINQSDFVDSRKIPSINKKIIYIGALESRKNVIFLLEVFKKLFEFDNDYALTIIGDGPDRNMVEKFIATYNLPVRLLGRISHMAVVDELFQNNLYLHSSTKESFSYALLEAKLAGLTTFAYSGLQVPSEFIDIKISDYDVDQWFDAIRNNNSMPAKIDSNKYTIEAMTSNTITIAG
jgi:glycosyltransferase involved in cell wall biosynthesis